MNELPPPAPYTLRISPAIVEAIRNIDFGSKISTSKAIEFLLRQYLDSIAPRKRMTPQCRVVYDIFTGKNVPEPPKVPPRRNVSALSPTFIPHDAPAPAPRRQVPQAQRPKVGDGPHPITSLNAAIQAGLCDIPPLQIKVHQDNNGRYYIINTMGEHVDIDNVQPGAYGMPIYDHETWEELGVPEDPFDL